MDRVTVHERPAKRVKRDEVGDAPTSPSPNHDNEDIDVQEPAFVSDNHAVHGSDLYLDTV
jgi:hypothetical protein